MSKALSQNRRAAAGEAAKPSQEWSVGGRKRASAGNNIASTVDVVVHEIREGIREYRYAPGQRLVEADLAKRPGVSRASIRDGIQRLAGDGIVQVEHQKGAIIRFLTRDEFISLIRVRELLEGLAARLAAENPNRSNYLDDLISLHEASKDFARRGPMTDYMDYNECFHDLVLKIAQDDYLAFAIRQAHAPLFRLQIHIMVTQETAKSGWAAHQQILEAIIKGKGEDAEKAMRSHIHGSLDIVRRAPDRLFR